MHLALTAGFVECENLLIASIIIDFRPNTSMVDSHAAINPSCSLNGSARGESSRADGPPASLDLRA